MTCFCTLLNKSEHLSMSDTKSPFVAGVVDVGRIGTRMVVSPPLLFPLLLLILFGFVAMMVDDELLLVALFVGVILIVALSFELVIYEVYWLATLVSLLFLKRGKIKYKRDSKKRGLFYKRKFGCVLQTRLQTKVIPAAWLCIWAN